MTFSFPFHPVQLRGDLLLITFLETFMLPFPENIKVMYFKALYDVPLDLIFLKISFLQYFPTLQLLNYKQEVKKASTKQGWCLYCQSGKIIAFKSKYRGKTQAFSSLMNSTSPEETFQ